MLFLDATSLTCGEISRTSTRDPRFSRDKFLALRRHIVQGNDIHRSSNSRRVVGGECGCTVSLPGACASLGLLAESCWNIGPLCTVTKCGVPLFWSNKSSISVHPMQRPGRVLWVRQGKPHLRERGTSLCAPAEGEGIGSSDCSCRPSWIAFALFPRNTPVEATCSTRSKEGGQAISPRATIRGGSAFCLFFKI